jgi:hypothetical protein
VGFVVNKVALVAGFLRVFWFPLPIFIPPISPQSPSPIIRGWYNRTAVAAVPKVPQQKLKKKIIKKYDVTSQETDLFTLRTVRTSDPRQKTQSGSGCVSQLYSASRENRHIEHWVQRKQALHGSISWKPQNSEHHYCIIWVIRGFMGTQYLGTRVTYWYFFFVIN